VRFQRIGYSPQSEDGTAAVPLRWENRGARVIEIGPELRQHTGWPQNGTIFVRLNFTKY